MSEILQDEDTQAGMYLTFMLGNENFGLDIKYVREIIGIQKITEIPEVPDYIRGILNLRGKIIPVTDVRLRFKKEFKEYNDQTCIIVIEVQDYSVGLIVDSVSEVLTIEPENIVTPPDFSHDPNKYVNAIGKVGTEATLLLNCEMLLNKDAIDDIVH
ncbi:chemotaxis protein CheW [Bacillus sp. FJAT-18017]|uniref:chemotaxis protein CheW n=1 Tax=Bacillus sp. FJAT-18017 TaxID=1705566 RepID=UPI0006B06AB7|nr:chemotaxis protein CheW [Bacillus sp. FJAT-18017]ALC89160.1 chemotaxis protein CheW [Bacillus sp. FJAT-18017]